MIWSPEITEHEPRRDLTELRLQAQMSIQDLARHLALPARFLNDVENGKQPCSAELERAYQLLMTTEQRLREAFLEGYACGDDERGTLADAEREWEVSDALASYRRLRPKR
jgi:transcriptional regulator with XRE-family HTH domain